MRYRTEAELDALYPALRGVQHEKTAPAKKLTIWTPVRGFPEYDARYAPGDDRTLEVRSWRNTRGVAVYLAGHLDDDPTNNRLDNLAWGSHSDNMLDWRSNKRKKSLA